jgi:hypothetical protein
MEAHFDTDVHSLPSSTILTGAMGLGPIVKRWNVDEYHKMIELGLVREGSPIELIDGFLVYKDRRDSGGLAMVQGSRHNLAVAQLVQLNAILDKLGFHIRIQSSFVVSPNHEPEPDGVVFRGKPPDVPGLPTARDAALVIEVADSSLEYDRTIKKQMYATAAIPVYWIVNLRRNVVEVYQRPDVLLGSYVNAQEFALGSEIPLQLAAASPVQIQVKQLIADVG